MYTYIRIYRYISTYTYIHVYKFQLAEYFTCKPSIFNFDAVLTIELRISSCHRKYIIASKPSGMHHCKYRVCQTLQELLLLLKPAHDTI